MDSDWWLSILVVLIHGTLVYWGILWTLVVGLLSKILSMISSLDVQSLTQKINTFLINVCACAKIPFRCLLVWEFDTHCCIPIAESINKMVIWIFFVSICIHFDTNSTVTCGMTHWCSHSYASSKLVLSCLLIVSFQHVEILTITTSHMHNSFNIKNRQNDYSLFLTCNDLPWT